MDHKRYFFDIDYSIMYKKYLAAPMHLIVDRFSNELLIKNMNTSFYWLPIRWRSSNNTQISGSHEREMKRSWYRRSRQGKHIYIDSKLFEPILGFDSKLLFFINNE